MSRHLEEMNYYNDPRMQAKYFSNSKYYSLRGSIVTFDEDWTEYLVEDGLDYLFDIEDGIARLRVSVSYQVCSLCEGHGTHVNPSIDCNGLTEDDMHDYEFMEDYRAGVYDVKCEQCNGRNVEPVIEFPKEIDKWLADRHAEDEADYAEMRAELAFGC